DVGIVNTGDGDLVLVARSDDLQPVPYLDAMSFCSAGVDGYFAGGDGRGTVDDVCLALHRFLAVVEGLQHRWRGGGLQSLAARGGGNGLHLVSDVHLADSGHLLDTTQVILAGASVGGRLRLSRCTVSWCARGIRHLADSLTLANGFGCGPRISLLRTGGLRVPTAAGATVWGGRGTHHGIDVLHFPVDKRVEGSGKPRGEHERASDKRGAEHDSEDCHKQPDFMCCDGTKAQAPHRGCPA